MNRDPMGYYALLGLKPNASIDEIRKAFRNRTTATRHQRRSLQQSAQLWKHVEGAYKTLINTETRMEYDQGWHPFQRILFPSHTKNQKEKSHTDLRYGVSFNASDKGRKILRSLPWNL